MKRFVILIALFTSIALSCSAVRLQRGSIECLKNESEITIFLNLEHTTYRKGQPLSEFINMFYRQENWLEESERYFTYTFNKKAYMIGLHSSIKQSDKKTKYELHIVPITIGKDGAFNKTIVYLLESSSQKIMAELVLDADDGDIDDTITFRDTMRDAGEQLAEFFVSKLKPTKK